MAEKIVVYGKKHVIVPVRFERPGFGSRYISPYRPDIDDGAFRRCNLPSSFNTPTDPGTRGAIVGVVQGQKIWVKIIREDISSSMPLFVTSADPQICEICNPRNNKKVASNGQFKIKGVSSTKEGNPVIHVRTGTIDGPIIGELEVHVFRMKTIDVRVHLVKINSTSGGVGAAPTVTKADITKRLKGINAIWRPFGISFKMKGNFSKPTVQLAVRNKVDASQGWAHELSEIKKILALGRAADREKLINWYIVTTWNDNTLGIGFSRDSAASSSVKPGIITSESSPDHLENCHLFAHELGHFFRLWHPHNKQYSPPGSNPARDSVSCRQLMYPVNNATVNPKVANCGYGSNRPGSLLTIRRRYTNKPGKTSDGEYEIVKKCVRSGRGAQGWY